MPWAGTSRGPESIVRTFVEVGRFWEIQAFETEALLGGDDMAAMFGRFTYKSQFPIQRQHGHEAHLDPLPGATRRLD